MEEKCFGFIINNARFPIDIKAKTEKQAFIKLIESHWSKIKNPLTKPIKIESLGKMIK